MAMARVAQSIEDHTQPSPCETKTRHDYASGNHGRSEIDNSIVCKDSALCETAGIRYMMGTIQQIFDAVMKELALAVRSTKCTLYVG